MPKDLHLPAAFCMLQYVLRDHLYLGMRPLIFCSLKFYTQDQNTAFQATADSQSLKAEQQFCVKALAPSSYVHKMVAQREEKDCRARQEQPLCVVLEAFELLGKTSNEADLEEGRFIRFSCRTLHSLSCNICQPTTHTHRRTYAQTHKHKHKHKRGPAAAVKMQPITTPTCSRILEANCCNCKLVSR